MAGGRRRSSYLHKSSFIKARGKAWKSKNNQKRKQYEEFGEAHPIEEKDLSVKRRKAHDTNENYDENVVEEDSDFSNDEENVCSDAVSSLLATFKTSSCKAFGSDEETALEEEDASDVIEETDIDSEDNHASSEEEKIADFEQEVIASDDAETLDQMQVVSDSTEVEEEEEDSMESQEDPFIKHFERNLSETAAGQIRDIRSWTASFQNWCTLGRIKVEFPNVEMKTQELSLLGDKKELSLLGDKKEETPSPNFAAIPKPPDLTNYNIEDYYIKKEFCERISATNQCYSSKCPTNLTDLQKELFCILSNYSDLYFPEATYEHWEEVRTIYAVHAINHILKTKKKVKNHTTKIIKAKLEKRYEDSDRYRDQGYAKPKILILLPFKHSAYRLVETIIKLLFEGKNITVQNLSRFREDFGPGEEGQGVFRMQNKAEDFQEIFKGNITEDFKIGLKLTKCSLKLYADFYHSDIIIASPLGLRYVVGNSTRTDAETDFLTSIEVLILDQADIFMMQNWEHVLVLMEVINRPPIDIHKLDADLTRVRLWSLEGHASLYRQTVVFSATHVDHNRALISKCTNFTGRLQVLNPVKYGSLQEVVVQAELVLSRIAGMRDPDSRFHYFTRELLPQLQSSLRSHTMIYIPDYCDYVRLVRFLKEDRGTSIATINEYMVGHNTKVAKARSLFFEGRRKFLLYTERFHFYRRYRIKGVRDIIFYDLPTYPHLFSEICNFLMEGNQNPRIRHKHLGASTVTVLFQRTDLSKLIGVLGSKRAWEVINSEKAVHLCVIGK